MDACNSRDSTFFQVKCMKMIYIITYIFFNFAHNWNIKKNYEGVWMNTRLNKNMLNYGGWLLWLHVKVVSAYICDPYL